jgi:hypothetical protein
MADALAVLYLEELHNLWVVDVMCWAKSRGHRFPMAFSRVFFDMS